MTAGAIDAHLHLWSLEASTYSWLRPDMTRLFRDFALEDVAEALAARSITGVVLVQADDDPRDTLHLLAQADRDDLVLGVVAYAPLHEPHELESALRGFASDPRVVGIRNLTHDRPDDAWLLTPAAREGLDVLTRSGLPLDIVTANAAHLQHVPAVSEAHPELRMVLDHLGKPPLGEDLGPWRRDLAAAAENPRLHAKISGLYAGDGPVPRSLLAPVVDWALECFGPERLMLGSDWPIAETAGGYGSTWDGIVRAIGSLAAGDQERIRSGTAREFYALRAPSQTEGS